MSETTPTTPLPAKADLDMATPGWQRKLEAKVNELHSSGKRAILLIDGSRIFVFSAEPRGTIALDR